MESRRMAITVPLQVLGVSAGYAAALGWLERKFPSIKPDHIWAEVAGGVLVSLVPVSLAAHQLSDDEARALPWEDYEGAVWRSFCAAGIPIILWQLGEAVFRRTELLSYNADQQSSSARSCARKSTQQPAEAQPETAAPLTAEVSRYLRNAQATTAQARDRMHDNPGLAFQLISEANHAIAGALPMLARIQGFIALASSAASSQTENTGS